MRRILKALVGTSGDRIVSSIPIPAVLRHPCRCFPTGSEGESTIRMADSPKHPARRRWASSLHTWALLCAVVLVPLVNTPDHLVWFDITPKLAVMLLMVGIATVSIPSELLDSPLTPKYSIFFPWRIVPLTAVHRRPGRRGRPDCRFRIAARSGFCRGKPASWKPAPLTPELREDID